MTNTTPNAPCELKPCPFCGDTPELPSGDGTQYEIECGGCGQAMACVQICDLMTLEERAADTFTDYRYGEEFVERAKVEAIERWNTRAPSPAGVDGLEAALSSEQILEVFERNGFRIELGASFSARGQIAQLLNAVGEIERLSGAQAIIDGLRGELLDASAERNSVQRERDAYKLLLDRECNDADSMLMTLGIEPDEIRTEGGFLMVAHIVSCISVQRDRQAQRVGDLDGLLRECFSEFDTSEASAFEIDMRQRIDAALSAGKEGE